MIRTGTSIAAAPGRPGARRTASAVAGMLLAIAASGCLGRPGVEERWTRIDLESASVAPHEMVAAGQARAIDVRVAVTYRSILTGVAVAELRASAVAPGAVTLEPDAPRPRMAEDIDRVLANSVTLGRATRPVTGWDHLIQHIDFSFVGSVPAYADSASSPTGLFLVCYLGSGEEIERADGTDSLVVTPFPSAQYEILPVGLELHAAAPEAP